MGLERGQESDCTGNTRPCYGDGVYPEDNTKPLVCFKQGKRDQFYILGSSL